MSEFDAYHRWLGIPSEEQPPDHYRLLGIARFESDVDVILEAAERQLAHVRRHGLGAHMEAAQKILTELALARVCLLDSGKRQQYDAALRENMRTDSRHEVAVDSHLVDLFEQVEKDHESSIIERVGKKRVSGGSQIQKQQKSGSGVRQKLPDQVSIPGVQEASYSAQQASPVDHRMPSPKTSPARQPQSPTTQPQTVAEDPHLVELFEQTEKDHSSSIIGRSGVHQAASPSKSGIGRKSAIEIAGLRIPKSRLWTGAAVSGVLLVLLVFGWALIHLSKGAPATGTPTVERDTTDIDKPRARIILKWPKQHRRNATLEIDGKPVQDILSMARSQESNAATISLAVEPGSHQVTIRKPPYPPYVSDEFPVRRESEHTESVFPMPDVGPRVDCYRG